jgi:hypothetical protein
MSTENCSDELDLEIAVLRDLEIGALKERFAEDFGAPPPRRLGKELMIRAIAHRIQERAEGGLRPALLRRLCKLAKELQQTGVIRLDDRRPVKPGTRLIRDWRGATHEVTVTKDGFIYRDQQYVSLSRIAREITGTRWSGPAFFGLKARSGAA